MGSNKLTMLAISDKHLGEETSLLSFPGASSNCGKPWPRTQTSGGRSSPTSTPMSESRWRTWFWLAISPTGRYPQPRKSLPILTPSP